MAHYAQIGEFLRIATGDRRDGAPPPERGEYRNTLRDLLHLNMTMFDPTAGFPRRSDDRPSDNVGATLVTSGHLLQGYLALRRQVTDRCSRPPQAARPRPGRSAATSARGWGSTGSTSGPTG